DSKELPTLLRCGLGFTQGAQDAWKSPLSPKIPEAPPRLHARSVSVQGSDHLHAASPQRRATAATCSYPSMNYESAQPEFAEAAATAEESFANLAPPRLHARSVSVQGSDHLHAASPQRRATAAPCSYHPGMNYESAQPEFAEAAAAAEESFANLAPPRLHARSVSVQGSDHLHAASPQRRATAAPRSYHPGMNYESAQPEFAEAAAAAEESFANLAPPRLHARSVSVQGSDHLHAASPQRRATAAPRSYHPGMNYESAQPEFAEAAATAEESFANLAPPRLHARSVSVPGSDHLHAASPQRCATAAPRSYHPGMNYESAQPEFAEAAATAEESCANLAPPRLHARSVSVQGSDHLHAASPQRRATAAPCSYHPGMNYESAQPEFAEAAATAEESFANLAPPRLHARSVSVQGSDHLHAASPHRRATAATCSFPGMVYESAQPGFAEAAATAEESANLAPQRLRARSVSVPGSDHLHAAPPQRRATAAPHSFPGMAYG
ncbi:unnamed protein product, partial [Polarella glacialis]